ncbi:glycosyltransferase, partial [Chryseobacterium sp. SIMBA_028]
AQNDREKQAVIKIFNPIDKADTLQKANTAIDDYPFSNQIPTFITIGTVYPQKGYDRLLDVHKKLIEEGLIHQIIIIGDGFDYVNIHAKLD